MTGEHLNLEKASNALDHLDDQVGRIIRRLERDYLLALAPQQLGAGQRLPTGQYMSSNMVDATRYEEAATRLLERYQATQGKLEHLAWLASKLQMYWRLQTGEPTETDRAEWEALRAPAPGLN